jgi:acyl carrier protein
MTADVTEYRAVVAEVFEIPPEAALDDASPQTVGQWNSMSFMKLVTRLESRFDVRLPLTSIIRVKNLGDLRRLVDAELTKT